MAVVTSDELGRDCDRVLARVAAGEEFDVMIGGRRVARLTPVARSPRRRFVPVEEFERLFATLPPGDWQSFRRDVSEGIDHGLHDPYAPRS